MGHSARSPREHGLRFKGCCTESKFKWACEFWLKSCLSLYAFQATAELKMHSNGKMIINEAQRKNGKTVWVEILRDVPQRANECPCEFWWESSYPLYVLLATTFLDATMHLSKRSCPSVCLFVTCYSWTMKNIISRAPMMTKFLMGKEKVEDVTNMTSKW